MQCGTYEEVARRPCRSLSPWAILPGWLVRNDRAIHAFERIAPHARRAIAQALCTCRRQARRSPFQAAVRSVENRQIAAAEEGYHAVRSRHRFRAVREICAQPRSWW